VGGVDPDAGWIVLCVVAVAVSLVSIRRDRPRAGDADGTGGTVREVIPSWQYGGRHVESGGLAREDRKPRWRRSKNGRRRGSATATEERRVRSLPDRCPSTISR
jgi:hypothetical protein